MIDTTTTDPLEHDDAPMPPPPVDELEHVDEPTDPAERMRHRMREAFGAVDVDAEIANASPALRRHAALTIVALRSGDYPSPDDVPPIDVDQELADATPEQREQIGLGFRLARAMCEGADRTIKDRLTYMEQTMQESREKIAAATPEQREGANK